MFANGPRFKGVALASNLSPVCGVTVAPLVLPITLWPSDVSAPLKSGPVLLVLPEMIVFRAFILPLTLLMPPPWLRPLPPAELFATVQLVRLEVPLL